VLSNGKREVDVREKDDSACAKIISLGEVTTEAKTLTMNKEKRRGEAAGERFEKPIHYRRGKVKSSGKQAGNHSSKKERDRASAVLHLGGGLVQLKSREKESQKEKS